jgi:hypothetical protein
MSTSFQAKSSLVLAQQLKVQEVSVRCNAVAGTSDCPGIVTVNNTSIADTVITLTVGETIASAHLCEVRNRATGAVVAIEAAPSLAVAQAVSVQIDGTGLTDLVAIFRYVVAE